MSNSYFIVLEGIDGSGKTTQAELLYKKMRDKNIECHLTSEPTEGAMGKLLRTYLKGENSADEIAVAALFTADRLDHLTGDNGIYSKLVLGISVVSDRYYFSSYAYNAQSYAVDTVIALNSPCADIRRPDLTVFIDVSPTKAMERIKASRSDEELEIYENEKYLTNVRSRYLKAFEKLKASENVVIIDGDGTIEEVADNIWSKVKVLYADK